MASHDEIEVIILQRGILSFWDEKIHDHSARLYGVDEGII
jgi:hypothetical protein